MDNSPNMYNTCFFPDCQLLSVTNGSIWIPFLARYLEIFKKPNSQVVKMKFHVHLKNAFQAEMETEGYVWLQSLVCLPPLGPTEELLVPIQSSPYFERHNMVKVLLALARVPSRIVVSYRPQEFSACNSGAKPTRRAFDNMSFVLVSI